MLRAGLTVALLVALLQAVVMPAAAASPDRLSQARARLVDLAAEIAERTAVLQARREALTIVNERISRASDRLGALELALQDVVASMERARARREAVQELLGL
jgi:septal ring factor EnvC (AmiA/AmiB activator)